MGKFVSVVTAVLFLMAGPAFASNTGSEAYKASTGNAGTRSGQVEQAFGSGMGLQTASPQVRVDLERDFLEAGECTPAG